jgi:hypothetical protein
MPGISCGKYSQFMIPASITMRGGGEQGTYQPINPKAKLCRCNLTVCCAVIYNGLTTIRLPSTLTRHTAGLRVRGLPEGLFVLVATTIMPRNVPLG